MSKELSFMAVIDKLEVNLVLIANIKAYESRITVEGPG